MAATKIGCCPDITASVLEARGILVPAAANFVELGGQGADLIALRAALTLPTDDIVRNGGA